MKQHYSLGTRVIAMLLCIMMILGFLPPVTVRAEPNPIAQIGEDLYESLEEAFAAVPSGPEAAETTITLLSDAYFSFDVGNESGAAPQNVVLDLGGKKLTLVEAVGSTGTKSNGIRVLANSALTVRNGEIHCSSETADNIKVGIANYGKLILNDVKLYPGALTMYGVNNRGSLTLKGKTEIYNGSGEKFVAAVTNDPYEYIYSDRPAEFNAADDAVFVGSLLVERYPRNTTNAAGVVLNISGGTYGKITEDGQNTIPVSYHVSGAVIRVATAEQLGLALSMAPSGDKTPVTIEMTADIAYSFDLGNETGTAPQNAVLDLGGKKLTLVEAVGSTGTKSNGIRVLANSALTVRNGEIHCSSETADNIKVGIANYGKLILNDVKLYPGALTMYGVNNRGSLTLKGKTEIYNGSGEKFVAAVTNDPYEYIYSDRPAEFNAADDAVFVGSLLVERYPRNTTNAAGVVLNISGGTYGNLSEDGGTAVSAAYNITGGSFDNDISAFLSVDYECVEQEGRYVVSYIKKEQTSFCFEQTGPIDLTYVDGLTFNNKANGDEIPDGKVTYTIVEEGSTAGAATVDAATGQVTILKAGTVIVKAAKTGNEMYLDALASYVLNIAPGVRTVSFGEEYVDVTYGTRTYHNPTMAISAQGTGTKVAYSIVSGGEIATIDSETGELTFADQAVGTVVVKAAVYGDDRYADCEATYKVVVSWLVLPADVHCGITGDTGENGWYKSNMVLTAPEGYLVGMSNSLDSQDWAESITFTEEGISEQMVYLKDQQGHISAQIPVSLKIDKTAPGASIEYIENENASLKDWFGQLIFGSREKVAIEFHLTGDDIVLVEWSKDDGENYEILKPEQGVYSVSIDPEYRGHLAVRVTDEAGWVTKVKDDGTLVLVDQITPELSANFREGSDSDAVEEFPRDAEDYMNSAADVFYLDFVFSDNNFDLTQISVGIDRLNGEDQENVMLEWIPAEDGNSATATIALSERDEYIVTATFQDPVNSGSRTYKVRMYNSEPELKVESMDVEDIVNTIDGVDYYRNAAGVTVRLSVTDDFFVKGESGVIINGEKTVINAEDWTLDEETGKYTKDVFLVQEGAYEIQAFYNTTWNGEKTSEVYCFVLDTTAPTVAGVEYKEITGWKSFFDKLFGFHNGDLTVVVNGVEDALSGVGKVEYSLDGGVTYEEVAASDEGYVFTVEAEYRGSLVVTVTDNAGNAATHSEESIVILDTLEPVIEKIEYEGSAKIEDNIALDVSSSDPNFSIIYTIVEDNLDVAPEAPKVYFRNNSDKDWTEARISRSEDGRTVKFTMSEVENGITDGTYRVKLVVQDHFSEVEKQLVVRIDRTAPEISVESRVDTDRFFNDLKYFKHDHVLEVKIAEENFVPSNVTVKVIRDGEEIISYANEAKLNTNWMKTGNLQQMNMTFAEEGVYEVSITCTDSLGTAAKPDATTGNQNIVRRFVVDKTIPEIDMTYQDELTFIETLKGLFGFKKDTITVNLNATDAPYATDNLAGIEKVQISVDGTNFVDAKKVSGNRYVFEVEERFQGQLIMRAIDLAGNQTDLLQEYALVVDRSQPGFTTRMTNNTFKEYVENGPLYTNHDPFVFWLDVEDQDTYDLFAGQAVVKDNGEVMEDMTWSNTETEGSAWVVVRGEGQHTLTAELLTGLHTASWGKTIIVDTNKPVIDIDFPNGEKVKTYDGFDYYDEGQTITITITEVNFDPTNVVLQMDTDRVALDEDGKVKELPDYAADARNPDNWTTIEGTNQHVLVLKADVDAVYELTVDYTDLATNVAETKKASFVVDTVAPSVDEVVYSRNVIAVLLEGITFGFAKADVQVQVTVSDHTAGVEFVDYRVVGTTGKDTGTVVDLSGTLEADENGRVESFELPADFYGVVYTKAWDHSRNASEETNVAASADGSKIIEKVVVDAVAPVLTPSFSPVNTYDGVAYFNEAFPAVLDLSVEETNFYKELFKTTVAVSSKNYEGEDDPYTITEWSSDGIIHNQTVTMNADAKYQVTVTGRDYSENYMDTYTTPEMVLDTKAPKISVELYELIEEKTYQPAAGELVGDTTYYDAVIKAVITIEERNFRAEDVSFEITGADPLDNELTFTIDPEKWDHNGDIHTYEVIFSVDGTYNLDVDYTDLAKNPGNDVQLLKFNVDNVNPDIVVEGLVDGSFNTQEQTVVIKITDANFVTDAEHLSYSITAVNSAGKDLLLGFPNLHNINNWTNTEGTNQWVATLTFAVEANYTIELSYTDLSKRTGYVHQTDNPLYHGTFTVDSSLPENPMIEYAEPVKVSEDETIYYYQDLATLTLTAQDGISGMQKLVLTVESTGLDAATTIELPNGAEITDINSKLAGFVVKSVENEKGAMTVVLEIPAGFNGSIGFHAVDMAGNTVYCPAAKTIVVDHTAPVLEVQTTPIQILNATNQETVALPEGGNAADMDNVVLYYADKAEFRFTMTEANFFAGEVEFTVNGEAKELTWVAREEAPEIYDAVWTSAADGDYVLYLSYTDRSCNETATYRSQRIVVDTKAPVMNVAFREDKPAKETDARDYYNAVRYATITIVDDNFRAEDVLVTVEAKDVTGATVGSLPAEYETRGKTQNGSNGTDGQKWTAFTDTWRREDDKYTIEIPFTTDANYTFSVSYKDLVLKEAETFTAKDFTVDTTVPQNLTMTYSMSPLETVLDGISFGYYDAQLQVTVTAEDATSGIDHFVYSYINREGVSSVNAELLNESLAVAEYSSDGKKATSRFTIPKSALGRNNQFNGTVQFDAFDRSTNSSHEDGVMGVVVDNIAPNATVTFNDPVQTVNGTEYYSGAINGRIVINEANFFSKDVDVVITRDGVKYNTQVNWKDNTVDEHVGTFTLTQEGDYTVTINYSDKSNNAMAQYKSATKVIDLAAPSIHVSKVVADSANDDDIYTFTITVEDADGNLRAEDIKPVLSGVFRNPDGTHTTELIDLGGAKVVASGRTFTYTVQDLPRDGIYTLSCSAADLARNTTSVIILDDGTAHESVRFSINRNGSTFDYGDDATRVLAENYYVQSVGHALVIHEINVDPINTYTVTLNGKTLVQGVDYTTTLSGGDGKWSLREYVIQPDLFAEEGEYSVVVSSVDATNSTAYSDMRNLNMSFVVDSTEPSIVIGGLANKGRYQNDGQLVTVYPSDEGGSLSAVRVELYDTDATPGEDEPLDILFLLEGEELQSYLLGSGGKIEFKVPVGYRHKVHIVCTDYAVDADGNVNTYTQTLSDITVSPNGWMIFYADKPAFYGTLAGVAMILALLIFLIVKKKKAKEEKTGV